MVVVVRALGHVFICWKLLGCSVPNVLRLPPQAQYILIHQALLEHTQFGETECPLQELHSTLSTLKQSSSDNESTLMEDEFDVRDTFLTTRLNEDVYEKGPACETFKYIAGVRPWVD